MADNKTNPISIRLTPKTKKAADKAAADESRTFSGLLEKVLSDWLKERGYLK